MPPWAILALVALVAVLILVGVAAATFSDRNWHPAITVNGVAIDRAHLRARVSLLRGLDDAMDAYLRDGRATGALTAEDEDALREALLPPRTLEDAMAGLVDDELTTTLARELNVSAERRATDAVATMLSRAVGPKLSWIEIRDSNALSRDSTARIAAATRALDSLSSGAALGVVSQTLKSSGWEVSSASGWLGALDQRLVPRAVLATIRKGPLEPRERLGPYYDTLTHAASVAVVDAIAPDATAQGRLSDAEQVDAGALDDWARAEALRDAITARDSDEWSQQPEDQVRAAELVVGAEPTTSDPACYVSLSHVVVDHLDADATALVPDEPASSPSPSHSLTSAPGAVADPCPRPGGGLVSSATPTAIAVPTTTPAPSTADRSLASDLAARLRTVGVTDRFKIMSALAERANASVAPTDTLERSGELGFFTREQLVPELAAAAFRADAQDGDVIGPVATAAGTELFVIRSVYYGVLDDRANAASVEARSTPDLVRLARKIAPPGDAARATGDGWRAAEEFAGNVAAQLAFESTPIGSLSDPFVFDGQILVVRPLERRTSLLEPDALARLEAAGVEAWLGPRRAAASVITDPDPLGTGAAAGTPPPRPSAGRPSPPAVPPSLGLPGPVGLPTPPPLP